MKAFLMRFATPLTAGLFGISTISGIALFFHWVPGVFHEMHEWLSMVLLVPFTVHLWRNWASMVGYAQRHALLLPLIGCLVITVPFAVRSHTNPRGGNPNFATTRVVTQARLVDLAPLLKAKPEDLLSTLQHHGFQAKSAEDSLASVATASGVR